jgi:hypothetical protein
MVLTDKLIRPSALAVAVLLLLASMVPLLSRQKVGAYGLLTSREIRMSSSAGGATDVTYLVRSTIPNAGNVGSAAIEFCSNSPIIGDSCTAPGSFDINEAGLVLANQTGITNWTIHANTDANTLILNRAAAADPGAITFTLELGSTGGTDGVTNPAASNTSFYARILLFADIDDDGDGCAVGDDWAGCYATQANHNASKDAGGIALSTAAQITVTAKVQERLTFCVYTDGDNNGTPGDANFTNCTGVAGTAVTLGDTNGVLSDSGPFVDKNTMYNVSTNASSGVSIRVKGATLTSGSFTIDASGTTPGNGTEQASTTNDEQFGFCTYRDTGGGAAGLTPDTNYDGAAAGPAGECSGTTQTAGTGSTGGDNSALFNFDLTTACGSTAANADFGENNLSCRYGDVIAAKTAGAQSTGRVVFVGNINTTTEPGIYTSTLTFIATGIN